MLFLDHGLVLATQGPNLQKDERIVMLSKVKWPMEAGGGFKRSKDFLKLDEDFGKGGAAVRVNQSSGMAQIGLVISGRRSLTQRRSLGLRS